MWRSVSHGVSPKRNFFFCKFFLLYIKISEVTYYQRSKGVILNRAKDYYESDKNRLRKQATDNYRNLSKEIKNKKREYGKNRYHIMCLKKRNKD